MTTSTQDKAVGHGLHRVTIQPVVLTRRIQSAFLSKLRGDRALWPHSQAMLTAPCSMSVGAGAAMPTIPESRILGAVSIVFVATFDELSFSHRLQHVGCE